MVADEGDHANDNEQSEVWAKREVKREIVSQANCDEYSEDSAKQAIAAGECD